MTIDDGNTKAKADKTVKKRGQGETNKAKKTGESNKENKPGPMKNHDVSKKDKLLRAREVQVAQVLIVLKVIEIL